MHPRTLVFIPTYNERNNVERMVTDLLSLGIDADLLFLDDNSPDGTGEILDGLATTHSRLSVIHRTGKLGVGSAHAAGIDWAYDHGYEVLVTLDCDFTHSPRDVLRLLENRRGYSVTTGSRYLEADSLPGWNIMRRSLTRFGHLLTTRLLGIPFDATGALRVYDLRRIPRAVFKQVRAGGYGFFFESMFVLLRNGHNVKEVPIVLPARTYDTSKMTVKETLRSGFQLLALSIRSVAAPKPASQGMRDRLRAAERIAAVAMTAAAITLNAINLRSAGGLWRDEANSIGLATLGSARDIWTNLQFDSFPLLWLMIVRALSAVFGPMNDAAFRATGFLVGASIIAGIWAVARAFGHRLPLMSLALLALCPALIRWGDSLRGYGPGIAAGLFTIALVWRFVETPSRARFVAAVAAAIISVHVLFYNSVVLLAICGGAFAVTARHRDVKRSAAVVAIGLIPALTLLPYIPVIRSASLWTPLVQIPDFSFDLFVVRLHDTLNLGGPWATMLWIETTALALFAAARILVSRQWRSLRPAEHDRAIFAVTFMIAGAAASYVFLKVLSYYPRPWYYLTLLAMVATAIDVLLGVPAGGRAARIAKVVGAMAIAVITFVPACVFLQQRITNVDQVAADLGNAARPDDLIVVTPWVLGVSFERYYRGQSPWTTLPSTSFLRFHRYDMIRPLMMERDQTAPIADAMKRAAAALSSGHRVFFAGSPEFPPAGMPLVMPGPAPDRNGLWVEGAYQAAWTGAFAQMLQQHAAKITPLAGSSGGLVSHYERLSVLVAEGWRP